MADNEDINLDGDGGAAPAKKGKGSGVFAGLLKWIIIGVAAIILIAVVVWGVVMFINHNSSSSKGNTVSVEYGASREILDWYKSIGPIQTFTNDEIPATVRVEIFLGYKKDDKTTSAEITQRSVEIQEFLRKYFRTQTASDLKKVINEDRIKIEIKNGINDKILNTSKVRSIAINQLDVLEQ